MRARPDKMKRIIKKLIEFNLSPFFLDQKRLLISSPCKIEFISHCLKLFILFFLCDRCTNGSVNCRRSWSVKQGWQYRACWVICISSLWVYLATGGSLFQDARTYIGNFKIYMNIQCMLFDDGGSKNLRNIGKPLPDYTVQHLKTSNLTYQWWVWFCSKSNIYKEVYCRYFVPKFIKICSARTEFWNM